LALRGWIAYSRGYIQDAVARTESRLRPRSEQLRHAASTLQLLSDLRTRCKRRVLCWHGCWRWIRLTPITRCMPGLPTSWKATSKRRSNHTGRCSRWISQTRWRAFSSCGSWPSIANTMPWTRYYRAPLQTSGIPSLHESAAFWRARQGADLAEAVAQLTPQIEAVARATDVFPRFLAQGFAIGGVARLCGPMVASRNRPGFVNYPFLARHDPSFETLRGDSAFKALLEAAKHDGAL